MSAAWNFMDALYFSMVTMSTVGYGDLSPDKRSGGLLFFTIVYIVTGVVVVFPRLANIVNLLFGPFFMGEKN